MLNRLDLRGVQDLAAVLPRPDEGGQAPVEVVREIIDDVRARGDEALLELTERLDGVTLETTAVRPEALVEALERTEPGLRTALEAAAANIDAFHRTQRIADHVVEVDGVVIRGRSVPVDRAGLYVPGGRAAYPSTVLMTAIPARVAGVGQLVLCVPPDRASGGVAEITLAAAAVAGVDEVHAVGGAQAIAAMAYGTDAIGPVDVIAGPGNLYVALAKRQVAGDVGVAAAFAGPSEIVVVADGSAPEAFVAVDLLVQAEHGPDGLAWLITWDPAVADAIDAEVARQIDVAPRGTEIRATLAANGWTALVDGPEQAIDVANAIAPEHLQLICEDAEQLADRVRHAGAVFTGPLSPASIGDYAAGPSHVLPTHGSARYGGALTVTDFCKSLHVISLDEAAFRRAAPTVEALARAEGLAAHADSVRRRLDALDADAQAGPS